VIRNAHHVTPRDREKDAREWDQPTKFWFNLPAINKPFMFAIRTLDRELWLRAETQADRDVWVRAIISL